MNIPERKRARAELLPLMDVIFMLMVLFIFMLIQMRPDFGMSVELPQVKEGSAAVQQEEDPDKFRIWISVDENNAFFVNKEQIDFQAAIVPAIDREDGDRERGKVRVIFKGDKKADFGVVVSVFNALQEAGYTDVLFDCDRE